jgi:tetratricopeptide (TPR) repeat protein
MPIGALAAADANLRRSIELDIEIEDRSGEASDRQERGRLLACCGDWDGAAAELDTALEQDTAGNHIQGQGLTWAYRALAALLQGDGKGAGQSALEALRLADENARTSYPVERDYVRTHWLLGWAALVKGDLPTASQHLDEALRRCRAINLVELEPAILLAQARLAWAKVVGGDDMVGAGLVPALDGEPPTGRPEKGRPEGGRPQGSPLQLAIDYAEEARLIAERSGYVLDLADIHNFLAQLALDAGQREEAGRLAQQAHDYAWCDGPPYAYQPALDEANRLLALVKA